MRLQIITAYNKQYKTLSDITYQTLITYSKKHSIECQRHYLQDLPYPPHWHKINLIRNAFSNQNQFVMWIDADAFINNHDIDIREYIDKEYDLIISEDFNGLNSGVMIWQDTPRSRAFLQDIWNKRHTTDHEFQEQHAITTLLAEGNQLKIKKVEQHILNAYDYNLYGLKHDGHYNKNSLIIHFPGITYPYAIRRTCEIMNQHASLNLVSEQHLAWINYTQDNWHKFELLDEIVKQSGELIEGDCTHQHHNILIKPEELKPKQLNIISAAIKATEALEIGFNAGHSALLMLLANPNLKLKCFDTCEHKYTKKCYYYLKLLFGSRIEMIVGNSTTTIPAYHTDHPSSTYDLIHIDGSHALADAEADLMNCYPLLNLLGTLIWDDVQCEHLNNLIEHNRVNGRLIEYKIHPTPLYPHRIFCKPIGIPPEGHNCQGHPMRHFANK